jgi:hypothetical protein
MVSMKLNTRKIVHLTAAFLVTMALFAFYPGKSNRFLLTANKEKPVMVFVLAGQSNAVGYNHISQLPPGDERLPLILDSLSGVLLWPGSNANPKYAGTWTNLKPGVSDISTNEPYKNGCFGPEIGFALTLKEIFREEKIAIIKYASGATGIARSSDYTDYIPALAGFDDQNLNWHPPGKGLDAGILYKGLIENIFAAIADLKAEGQSVKICGFLWMQGEHEGGISKKMALDYDKLLMRFRDSIYEELKISDVPFLIGEVNSHTWAYGDLARNSQAGACRRIEKCVLIKTTDLPRGGIGGEAHFNAQGMLLLGERFARGYLQIIDNKIKAGNYILNKK